MSQSYPERPNNPNQKMNGLGIGIPETMKGFSDLHRSSIAEGALTTKTKELIAFGIATTIRCDGRIAYHVHDSLQAGAKTGEIVETIPMGGGPSVVYGCQVMEALAQLPLNRMLPKKGPRGTFGKKKDARTRPIHQGGAFHG